MPDTFTKITELMEVPSDQWPPWAQAALRQGRLLSAALERVERLQRQVARWRQRTYQAERRLRVIDGNAD